MITPLKGNGRILPCRLIFRAAPDGSHLVAKLVGELNSQVAKPTDPLHRDRHNSYVQAIRRQLIEQKVCNQCQH